MEWIHVCAEVVQRGLRHPQLIYVPVNLYYLYNVATFEIVATLCLLHFVRRSRYFKDNRKHVFRAYSGVVGTESSIVSDHPHLGLHQIFNLSTH